MGEKSKKKKRSCLKRIGLTLLILIAVLVLGIAIYATITDMRSNAVEMPEDSILVDVGGRNIHMRAMGLDNDGPAVVLIWGFSGGLTSDSAWWAAAQGELSKTMRVYAFDYPGFAWSDPDPDGLSHSSAADDLHVALTALGEDEVILVAQATGSNTTIFYADRYPVDGIIWIDPDCLHPEVIDWYEMEMSALVDTLLRGFFALGGYRLWDDYIVARSEEWAFERLGERGEALMDWDYYNAVDAHRGTRREGLARFDFDTAYNADLHNAAALLPIDSSIPLTIIQTDMLRFQGIDNPERAEINAWRGPLMSGWFKEMADNSEKGQVVFIEDSDHIPMIDQPDEFIAVVEDFVARVRDD
jgi:polyhydroxybutyrate depolymerase